VSGTGCCSFLSSQHPRYTQRILRILAIHQHRFTTAYRSRSIHRPATILHSPCYLFHLIALKAGTIWHPDFEFRSYHSWIFAHRSNCLLQQHKQSSPTSFLTLRFTAAQLGTSYLRKLWKDSRLTDKLAPQRSSLPGPWNSLFVLSSTPVGPHRRTNYPVVNSLPLPVPPFQQALPRYESPLSRQPP
jgi:hypothetical protein